jgi:hypothetical protein
MGKLSLQMANLVAKLFQPVESVQQEHGGFLLAQLVNGLVCYAQAGVSFP